MDAFWSLLGCKNILLFSVISLCVYVLVCFFGARKVNLPPGPKGWPIFGNIFQLANLTSKEKFELCTAYTAKYGDIFCLKVGPVAMVYLCSFEMIHEAFVKKADILNDRPHSSVMKSFNCHLGVIFGNGIAWKKMRRFSTGVLRHFGIGTDKMERSIKLEAECLLQEMQLTPGQALNITHILHKAVSNVISQVIVGHRYEYNDERFANFLEIIDKALKEAGNRMLILMSPWMQHVPILGRGLKALYDYEKIVHDFLDEEIDAHRNTLDADNPRDLIDYYLLKPALDMEDRDAHLPLRRIAEELFEAGTDTILSSLSWALLFMVKYPEFQKKAQEELDRVIGTDRRPTMADMVDCPYTNAVTMESLRLGTTSESTTLEHIAHEDTTIGGYDIPKGTIVYGGIHILNHLGHVWKDPVKFNPENFLDVNGKFRNIPEFIAFGIGPRVCMGERMARMVFWLFFTFILQEFTLSVPPGDPEPALEAYDGLVRQPLPFRIRVETRD